MVADWVTLSHATSATTIYLGTTGQSKRFKMAIAPSHHTLASMVVTHLEIEIKGKLAKQRHTAVV